MLRFLFLALLAGSLPVYAQTQPSVSFEQVLSLRQASGPVLSPDGQHVVYTITTADWKENRYDAELWMARPGEAPFQLTRTAKGSSSSPRWSPDGKWLAFLADRGDKMQIFVMSTLGGEAKMVTKEEEGVSAFDWSPDGKSFAMLIPNAESKAEKNKKERYGGFAVDDEEYTLSHLWLIDFKPDLALNELPLVKDSTSKSEGYPKATQLTRGDFTVTSFEWSPDGSKIGFTHQPTPLINSSGHSDVSMVEVTSKKTTLLVHNPSGDTWGLWSPDGKRFLYESDETDSTSNYYKNGKWFVYELATGKSQRVLSDFDENISPVKWTNDGVFFGASQKTNRFLFLASPSNWKWKSLLTTPEFITGVSFSTDGKTLAFAASSANQLAEIYRMSLTDNKPLKLTSQTSQIANWPTAQSEVISWKSQDGTIIEGVLHKPKHYDSSRKYPLLVIIHGGPTGVDVPTPVPGGSVYPALEWLEKGCLILRPNYRGSAGYGEKFRSLNVKNLGVGDTWDVLSGVDFLSKKGLIDTTKMGAMGWSQGGYISAFLTTHTTRFKAISVGAGISNWMTYYVNTDIHPFTRQYLMGTPWNVPEVYKITSPMTTITQAHTPTLIQHGEFDRRVPIANAYELLQGLQDQGVPAKLVVYKGFGHGITKPKERLAAMWHNWTWFNQYIWGEKVLMP
ncbi:MAG: S9 family peptidase [Siphonobacter sp.]